MVAYVHAHHKTPRPSNTRLSADEHSVPMQDFTTKQTTRANEPTLPARHS
jgi:hypothetical protein